MNGFLEEALREQIETELEFCDSIKTPVVCYNLADPKLRGGLIDTIFDFVLSRKITISQAINEVESLYKNNNDLD